MFQDELSSSWHLLIQSYTSPVSERSPVKRDGTYQSSLKHRCNPTKSKQNSKISEHLKVEEKKSWKLFEPILTGFLLVVDPHLSIQANILNSCGYILMLLNQYKSTPIPTKEMSSSAQSSAIVSRFFTIWDFGSVRFYPISSLLDVLIYLRYHCWAKPARTSLSLFVLKKRTAMWSNLLTRPPRTTSVTFH